MIFWWSEARLADYIDKRTDREHILHDISSVEDDVKNLNSCVETNVRDIQSLKKIRDELAEIREASSAQSANEINRFENRLSALEHNQSAVLSKADYNSSLIAKLQEIISKQNPVSVNKDEIESDILKSVNEKISSNNIQINNSFAIYDNKLRQLNEQIEKKSGNVSFEQLINEYTAEKKKNDILTARVTEQSEKIDSLTRRTDELEKQISMLVSRFNEKAAVKEDIAVKNESVSKVTLIFDDDSEKNKSKLEALAAQAEILKEKLHGMGFDDANIYVKLVNSLTEKMAKLISQNEEKHYGAEKLAHETARIFKQTIVKGLVQSEVRNIIIQYMDECGIRKLDWKVGKKLEGEDYDYLEEPILFEEVPERSKAGTILEIMQDTYVIDYLEDDEKQEAVIPGFYRIGK